MEKQLLSEERIVQAVVQVLLQQDAGSAPIGGDCETPAKAVEAVSAAPEEPTAGRTADISDDDLVDVALMDENDICLVQNPKNREALMRMKRYTPARLATGRCGEREKTLIMLRKNANLAATVDAVWTPVNREFVQKLGYPTVKSLPTNKEEYMMRPDLGRLMDEENMEIIRTKLKRNPDVQIVLGEGQSNPGLEQGMPELLPALLQGLELNHIDYGTPVFVEYTRVGIGDLIAQEIGAKAVCVVLGERPGLLTWAGLGCYITYAPTVDILESKRTVVSNIQDGGGTPPAEAGAYIADLIKRILTEKKSGVDLIL